MSFNKMSSGAGVVFVTEATVNVSCTFLGDWLLAARVYRLTKDCFYIV